MNENINKVVAEAARILRDYPDLKYGQAIAKAKEVINDDASIRQNKQA